LSRRPYWSGSEVGTQARIKRANDTNELNGIKIKFTEFSDDKLDPAIATATARKIVTQDKVFAIVPNISSSVPAQYLADEKVLSVGYGVGPVFCNEDTSSLWGFGYNGCLTPTKPKKMTDNYSKSYAYVTKLTGKKTPTAALFSGDASNGAETVRNLSVSAEGEGFKVVYAKSNLPQTVTDYSPYVQQWITSDNGGPPDMITCLATTQCVSVIPALRAAGYKGVIQSPLFDDRVVSVLKDTITLAFFNTDTSVPAYQQMRKDFDAIDPKSTFTLGSTAAYFAADMFIQALKAVGTNITPENVRQALLHQNWEISNLAGPTKYPESGILPTPSCSELVYSDGTKFNIVVPWACNPNQYSLP
jgi:ABC-type branched-subunit amino acid transport system substrate-binding protein